MIINLIKLKESDLWFNSIVQLEPYAQWKLRYIAEPDLWSNFKSHKHINEDEEHSELEVEHEAWKSDHIWFNFSYTDMIYLHNMWMIIYIVDDYISIIKDKIWILKHKTIKRPLNQIIHTVWFQSDKDNQLTTKAMPMCESHWWSILIYMLMLISRGFI